MRWRARSPHARYVPGMAAPTVATLAELRVRQGRLAEAEQLLAGRQEHPSALRALAHLRIAQDEARVAAALLERGLLAAEDDAMRATQLLAPLVDARLACGDVEGAGAAARELGELANSSGIGLVEVVRTWRRRVAHATDRASDAAEPPFGLLPHLTGSRCRSTWARRVSSWPERLPATSQSLRATRRAPPWRRSGSWAPRARWTRPRRCYVTWASVPRRARAAYGELTAREQEVLGLLAQGMSNAQIAQTLVISEKTAGHHVSRILSKLGVRNRAEAAAHAARAERVPRQDRQQIGVLPMCEAPPAPMLLSTPRRGQK